MINRATAAKLIDCKHDSLQSLERLGVITPSVKGYSYNQLIFSRILFLIRDKLNLRTVTPFLMAFGKRPQYEIIFSDVDLMILVNNAVCFIPSSKDDLKLLCNEWLLPIDQECFLGSDLSERDLQGLINIGFTGNPDLLVLIPIYRVKNFIDNRALELKLDLKLEKVKKQELFDRHENILVG